MNKKDNTAIEKDNIIAKFSLFFATNIRITILILIFISLLGFVVFSSLLKREGFPTIDVPAIIIQANYFVNDQDKFNEEVTKKIESSLEGINDIKKVDSVTNDNFATIYVLFPEGYDTAEGKKLIEQELSSVSDFPETATFNVREIKATSVDGVSDLVFSLVSENKTQAELQELAKDVAEEVGLIPEVQLAFAKNIFVDRANPLTGEAVLVQESFNRFGENLDGKMKYSDAVSVGIVKKESVGTVELSEAVREKIEEIKKDDKFSSVEFKFTSDQADILNEQINSLGENAVSGAIAVLIVVLLFINLRASIITAIFIPLTLAATFITLYLIGYTLNVLVLFALILVLGLFVDDATVIVESIDYYKKQGYKGLNAIRKAINSVGVADVSGTITTMLVFFPLATISGVLGDFIKVVPVTVIVALGLSLILALSIVSLLSGWLLSNKKEEQTKKPKFYSIVLSGLNYPVSYLGAKIESFIKWYLKRPLIAFGVILPLSIVLIGVGGMFAGRIGFQIFPESKDSLQIQINISTEGRPDINNIVQAANEIEGTLASDKYKNIITSYTFTQAGQQSARISVRLTEIGTRDKKAPELVKDLNQEFTATENTTIKASVVSAGPSAAEFPLRFQVYSEDISVLEGSSKDIISFLESQIVKTKDKEISIIQTNLNGLDSVQKIDGKRYGEVSVKLSEGFDSSTLLDFQKQVKDNYTPEKLNEFGLDADAIGYDLGQESSNLESFNSAIMALLVALIVMYILLVTQYNSFTQPLLIFVAIPFTFFLLFPGLAITNNPMSFFVVIGLTGLIGIVVNNTIMLIEFVNQSKLENLSLIDSIAKSVRLRLRPILTTSSTTVAGLLPLALTDPFWEPLALTIVFGLISSVIMVLIFFAPYIWIVETVRTFVKTKVKNLLKF